MKKQNYILLTLWIILTAIGVYAYFDIDCFTVWCIIVKGLMGVPLYFSIELLIRIIRNKD